MSGKIFMFCPDFKPPSGGTKRVYHLTQVLRRHGFDACAMHTRPGFRLNWVGIDVPIVYMRDSLGRVKIEDILVIPEGWPHTMELTVSLPCKKIAFAMSVEYILPKLPSGVTWRDFGIRQAITTTPGVAHFVEVVMQIPVYVIGSSIDCSFFHFVPEKKRKLIVYAGRAEGNREEAEIMYRILGMLNSVFNDYELLPVTDLSLPDYRDVLMQAEYYLTLVSRWANNTGVLEAMACGCVVGGYAGMGCESVVKNAEDCLLASHGDYRIKHFKCWDQLACMTLAHIRQEDSLRDIDITLNAHASKLYHIGIKQCPKSTLADANERRDYRIYEEFAKTMMHRARREYAQTELAIEIDNSVYALDASTIDLTLSLYPWAKFRKTKGAIKMHAMLDLRGNIPAFLYITDRKVHDIKATPQVPIEPEGIYLVDRAYIDFSWLWSIHQRDAFFVTRLKKAIKWTRILSHPVDKSLGLRSDQEILLASKKSKSLYPKRLRRISFRDEMQGRTLVFLTKNFILSAETIAALYKARWEIELFFKWIKQNLKIKTFLGTSPNAVKTQIWIAMVVYLVLAILKERYHLDFPMSKLLHFLEVNLFEQKPLLSIFQINPRYKRHDEDKQLKLFDF